ncbi:sugar kinase [Endozoicomonas elysicola]|uniref:sugar kinase n=1 Tax=Endozoicomonas elysicola TaxID=305900 RepID=UPI001267CEBB|nr:sugar kinase [Endozoicomonas elysicola]
MYKKPIEWQCIGFIGEAMLELSSSQDSYQVCVAGDTYNTSVYLQRLINHKAQIFYISGLGIDRQSEKIKSSLVHEGIDTQGIVEIPDKQPGLYMIDTTPEGERSFSYWRDNSAAKYWLETQDTERVLKRLKRMDAIYLSGISIAILSNPSRERLLTLLEGLHDDGKAIIFDNNFRSGLWESTSIARQWYDRIFQITNIALITVDDDQALYKEIADDAIIERCRKHGIDEIILKRGADNCLVARSGEKTLTIPAIKINQVVDTTAAGDSFAAGYLAGRITGKNPEFAAVTGHSLASVVIQHRGAIIHKQLMPSL